VCKQEFQGPLRTDLLGAQADDTKALPVDHPHRIWAIVALARETAGYKDVDPAETFARVLRMKRMIDRHPMAVKWVPDVYLTIATCLKRMGRHEQAVAQSTIGLDRLISVEWPVFSDDYMKGAMRLSLLCAINYIEVEKATDALRECDCVLPYLEQSTYSGYRPINWSSGTVSVHEGPLTLWVARWMEALQTGDEAAQRRAQVSFARAEATVRRVFGSSHVFTLKWIEWRKHLMSPRTWERPPR
jgi:hypothetical protein